MAESFTTNCYFEKPEVAASESTWGGFLNANLDTQDVMMAGLLYGLTLSAAGATATFGVAAGAANGMNLASAYTKTTGAWVVGTWNGSLDTGAIANSTWYHVWLIMRTDTMVVDILTSLSATAPTMPTNYTRKRRIGAMKTDGSAHWLKFVQVGDEFIWDVPVQDISTSTLGTTATDFTLASVPSGVKVTAHLRGWISHANPNIYVILNSKDESVQAGNVPAGNATAVTQVASQAVGYNADIRSDTSAKISGVSTSASTTVGAITFGWRDDRGRVG